MMDQNFIEKIKEIVEEVCEINRNEFTLEISQDKKTIRVMDKENKEFYRFEQQIFLVNDEGEILECPCKNNK